LDGSYECEIINPIGFVRLSSLRQNYRIIAGNFAGNDAYNIAHAAFQPQNYQLKYN
jgi:hypothetical protein